MTHGNMAQFDDHGCPDDLTLEAMVSGTIDPATEKRVAQHLRECTICHALGNAIRVESKMGKLLRESAAETERAQRDRLIARARAALSAENFSKPPEPDEH